MLALKLEMRASNKKWFKTKDKSEKNEIWMKEGLEGKKAFLLWCWDLGAKKCFKENSTSAKQSSDSKNVRLGQFL